MAAIRRGLVRDIYGGYRPARDAEINLFVETTAFLLDICQTDEEVIALARDIIAWLFTIQAERRLPLWIRLRMAENFDQLIYDMGGVRHDPGDI